MKHRQAVFPMEMLKSGMADHVWKKMSSHQELSYSNKQIHT